eukprot:1376485-Rhodomonas_salina.1
MMTVMAVIEMVMECLVLVCRGHSLGRRFHGIAGTDLPESDSIRSRFHARAGTNLPRSRRLRSRSTGTLRRVL